MLDLNDILGDMKQTNRRKRTRITCPASAMVRSGSSPAYEAQCRDLSANGIFLIGPLDLDLGDVVEIDMLPEQGSECHRITVKGNVVRRDPEGIGVVFLEMDEESFHNLKLLLEYRSGDSDRVEKEMMSPAFGKGWNDPS